MKKVKKADRDVAIRKAVESQKFYELMQRYRFAPIIDQQETTEAFYKVQSFIIALCRKVN